MPHRCLRRITKRTTRSIGLLRASEIFRQVGRVYIYHAVRLNYIPVPISYVLTFKGELYFTLQDALSFLTMSHPGSKAYKVLIIVSSGLGSFLALLPYGDFDEETHFFKTPKYDSETLDLLLCQEGSCPGISDSPTIVNLLGRTRDGRLVFERFEPYYVLALLHPLTSYRSWILQIISGLQCLHSFGMVLQGHC